MKNDFEELLNEVIQNKYIKTVDDEIYLPSKNEDKLRESGFEINDKIIEELLTRYRVEVKKAEKKNSFNKKEKKRKSADKRNKFAKENWFKILMVVVVLIVIIIYIISNRYHFITKEKSNRFSENGTIEVIMKCDKFTGECEQIQ